MNEYDCINDLSNLTTIPEVNLNRLFELLSDDICQCVVDSCQKFEDTSIIDLNFGKLVINIDNEEDNIKYKFIPSRQFENALVKSIIDKKSPLIDSVEKSLSKKIVNLYKELL